MEATKSWLRSVLLDASNDDNSASASTPASASATRANYHNPRRVYRDAEQVLDAYSGIIPKMDHFS